MHKVLFLLLVCSGSLFGGHTSLFWTRCTTSVVPLGEVHIPVNIYVGKPPANSPCNSFGIKGGVFETGHWKGELGIDYNIRRQNPFLFNAKIGTTEDSFFDGSPSFSLGIFGVGLKGATSTNVFDVVFGKKIDWQELHLYLGAYQGNSNLQGQKSGVMVGIKKKFLPVVSHEGKKYHRIGFEADYSTGKNSLGGGGPSLVYYFSPNLNLQGGPVWFNKPSINGNWKIYFQLNFYL